MEELVHELSKLNGNGWKVTKEKILMFFGLALIALEAALAAIGTAGPLTWQFVIAGLALCGISITQWGDKGGK